MDANCWLAAIIKNVRVSVHLPAGNGAFFEYFLIMYTFLNYLLGFKTTKSTRGHEKKAIL